MLPACVAVVRRFAVSQNDRDILYVWSVSWGVRSEHPCTCERQSVGRIGFFIKEPQLVDSRYHARFRRVPEQGNDNGSVLMVMNV